SRAPWSAQPIDSAVVGVGLRAEPTGDGERSCTGTDSPPPLGEAPAAVDKGRGRPRAARDAADRFLRSAVRPRPRTLGCASGRQACTRGGRHEGRSAAGLAGHRRRSQARLRAPRSTAGRRAGWPAHDQRWQKPSHATSRVVATSLTRMSSKSYDPAVSFNRERFMSTTYGHATSEWETARSWVARRLHRVARDQGTITYSDLADEMAKAGLLALDAHSPALAALLGQVNVLEHEAGQPLVSALV